MNIDYGYIKKWLSERYITVQTDFTEQLKSLARLYSKNII